MGYGNFIGAALLAMLISSPVLVGSAIIRAHYLLGRGYRHPWVMASVETALVSGIITLAVVTVGTPAQGGRSVDLNPLVGISGTHAFTSLFIINFIVLPMPLATIATIRFHRLASPIVSAVAWFTIFFFVETMQFVRGGRVASTQDILLSTAGATLAAAFVGRVGAPASHELTRLRKTAPSSTSLWAPVSKSWLVATLVAVLCPLALVLNLPSPTASPTDFSASSGESACGLAAGSWTVPLRAPSTTWVQIGHRVLPMSRTNFGPVRPRHKTRCFARNPTGALYAAAWEIQLAGMSPSAHIVGFRFNSAYPDAVDLTLLFKDRNTYVATTSKLHWAAGDWRVRSREDPVDPQPLRLDAFVTWDAPRNAEPLAD